jgi:signal transduction histidine kinase
VATALRTGQAQLVPQVTTAWLTAVTRGPEHYAIVRALAPASFVVVPLVARGRVLGVLSFAAAEPGRRYSPADLSLAEELARRAALAVDNARLYQEAQAAAREAEAAVRLRDDFLARASHELRTPLTSALGTIRLLTRAMAGTLKESPEVLIDIASRNLGAMVSLIEHLLDVSKLGSGRVTLALEPVALATAVSESLAIVGAPAREKGVRLEANVPAGLRLGADRLRLEQLLVNLLANAIKFTPPGGRVVIEAEAEAGDVLIRVRDTGEGIRAEDLRAIFEPFVQGGEASPRGSHDRRTRRVKGTGLGLAICRQIVTLHGGRIWAESEGLGKGSTFVVSMPRGAEADSRAA